MFFGLDRSCTSKKGVSLIIVIFALMLLSILGWTLMSLVSTQFDANYRFLSSAQSLYLAEAGAQWALMQLLADSAFRTTGVLHRLPVTGTNGEYYVVCRDPQAGEEGVIVESFGYYPLQSRYDAMRVVKLVVNIGGAAFLRSGTIRHFFDWKRMDTGSYINGDILVVDVPSDDTDGFDGDGVLPNSQAADLNVPDKGGTTANLRDTVSSDNGYPLIDLPHMRSVAKDIWTPDYSTASVTAVTKVNNTTLRIQVDNNNFFRDAPSNSSWVNDVIVRNRRGEALGLDVKWAYKNWGVISKVNNNSTVELQFDASVGDMGSAGNIWSSGNQIQIGRRFSGSLNNDYWYVEGDMLLDLRSGVSNCNKSSFCALGDIALLGTGSLSMKAHVTAAAHETLPNIATKDGNIYSTSTNNSFDGLIYTETGDIWFNNLDGISVMGKNIRFDGLVYLNYNGKYVDDDGFLGGAAGSVIWQEE